MERKITLRGAMHYQAQHMSGRMLTQTFAPGGLKHSTQTNKKKSQWACTRRAKPCDDGISCGREALSGGGWGCDPGPDWFGAPRVPTQWLVAPPCPRSRWEPGGSARGPPQHQRMRGPEQAWGRGTWTDVAEKL
ncbi:hypothetical protein NDU88_006742 [Pleurodeles waltl]|uniref:Uncharacterized protein n=1 Tax=Pleurodeles waltl TaxID=8319 RepID=A0AAV7X269_PLEWA|nr:hypothetical protein NDU88_006742 [Pleurodeles waltl]